MKVLEVCDPFGLDSIRFAARSEPKPNANDLVIRVTALSLNFRDRLVLDGVSRWRPSRARIPVSDGVGVVAAIGRSVRRFHVGDRVAPIFYPKWYDGPPTAEGLQSPLGGACADGLYSEYAVIDESAVVGVPAHLSDEEGATLPCAAVTAWNAVTEGRVLTERDTVVVLGTGGVALFALQFAARLGARVIVTSSSDAKLTRARALGADGTINYKTSPDWASAVRDLTRGAGADLVVDTAGELAPAIEAVRVGGTIASIGLLRGMRTEIDLVRLMGSSATIRAVDVGSRAMFESMNEMISATALHPVIDRTFRFDEAVDAYRHLIAGDHFGKVCISIA